MQPETVSVYFIGAGPGDPELLTLKAARIIKAADVLIVADSLVDPAVLAMARPGAEIYTSADRTLEQLTDLMLTAAQAGKLVARLQSGDPALYGAIREQMAVLRAAGVTSAVIPGVSSVFAAAAALGAELTVPGMTQTVILTRREGRTPVPARESLKSLAAHRATLAIFLSVPQVEAVCADLTAGGYPPQTPVSVVYRASWPEEQVISATLKDISSLVAKAGIERQALILVGDALGDGGGEPSRLYDAGFNHGFRQAKP